MSRSPKIPTAFIIIYLFLLFEASNLVKCRPSFEEETTAAKRGANKREIGNACKANLWGYNCLGQLDMYIGGEQSMHDKRFRKISFEKRSCIIRGGACDHRPKQCCNQSSCRCNLWGSNCRCQRVGLFQKWG